VAQISPRITDGDLQRLVESQGQKALKKSNNHYIATSCLGWFQEKSSSLIQKQTPAYLVLLVLELQN